MLANAPGGINGQVSKAWKQAHRPDAAHARQHARPPDRDLLRARALLEARRSKVHATSPWLGTGAGAYATLRTRFRTDALAVRHAHGYVVQTLADLGWVGLALSLLARGRLAGRGRAGVGVRRARPRAALGRRARRPGHARGRRGRLRHPLGDRLDVVRARQRRARRCCARAGSSAAGRCSARLARPKAPRAPPAAGRMRAGSRASRTACRRSHGVAAALVIVLALAAAWTRVPAGARAARRATRAFDRLDRAQLDRRCRDRPIATERNPLSAEPLFELAAIEQARGDLKGAQAALEKAVELEPANAETWRRLGDLRLNALNDTKGALSAYQAAYYLDPQQPGVDDRPARGQPRRSGHYGRTARAP